MSPLPHPPLSSSPPRVSFPGAGHENRPLLRPSYMISVQLLHGRSYELSIRLLRPLFPPGLPMYASVVPFELDPGFSPTAHNQRHFSSSRLVAYKYLVSFYFLFLPPVLPSHLQQLRNFPASSSLVPVRWPSSSHPGHREEGKRR